MGFKQVITKKVFFSLFVIFTALNAKAQHQDPSWSARSAIINDQCVANDSLCNVLHNLGTFEGHVRNFFMATVNHADYPDYYAHAIGGGLGYYSPIIKNFQVGLSGYAIYKIASSPLGPEGPYQNRYELALFDVSDPHNTEDLDRLEDLYLRYYLFEENKSYAQIGKFHLKTPLVNLQDGRMRPNLQEGTWFEFNELDKVKIKAGWLWATSPRGTVKWYGMGESVGVYPNGKAVNGNKAQYAGNVSTRNVLIGALSLKPTKDITYQLWNYYADNLFNISLHKFESKKEKPHATIYAGMQYLWQQSLYNDTLAIEKQYITQAEQSHSFSGRLSVTNKHSGEEWNLNYTRITSHGRFLFPREWGVESFYTFMQRERMEGMGDVHAVMVQNNHGFDKHKQLSLHSSAGIFLLPEVDNARINKYAMPSFYQVNLRMSYKFSGFLQGLQTDVLYLYKGNLQNSIAEVPAFYHNKVDMHHLSVVLDYYF